MPNRHRLVHAVLPAALTATVILTGCGGSDPAANAPSQEPEVDPRFASAEALCAEFSRLESMGLDGGPAFVDMLYAENEWQERTLTAERNRIRVHHAEVAMHDRFGVSIKAEGDLYFAPMIGEAVLEKNDGVRAVARLEKEGMPPSRVKLHLVRMNHRWWISLYTIEYAYSEDEKAQVARDQLIFEAMAAGADQVLPGLQANWYRTAEEAQSAYLSAMRRYALDHPYILGDQ